jgi:LysM repeat protein
MRTHPALLILPVLGAGLLYEPPPLRAQDGEADGLVHVVQAGETLSAIAAQHGLSLSVLLEHNGGLDPDRIRAGQRILLDADKRRIIYTFRAGDTLSAIARRHGVALARIVEWNRGTSADRIREGQTLVLWSERPRSESRSLGTPDQGRLERARKLPPHPGFVIRERGRAFGTDEAVEHLIGGIESVRRQHASSPRLRVHDLSLSKGGPMSDHRSHQSGRDADLSFFQRSCPAGVCPFRPVGTGEIDVERTWTLLHHWLERDALESVFIDYKLQAALYRHARAQGASRQELRRWFQYPNGPTYPLGVIRHFPRHQDHMHVRFMCHHSDAECKTFRPLLTEQAQAAQASGPRYVHD